MAGPTIYFARAGRDGPIKIGGIRDWHWSLLMSLCDVSVMQLYAANQMPVSTSIDLRVA